jgi:hypothetical protein
VLLAQSFSNSSRQTPKETPKEKKITAHEFSGIFLPFRLQ